MPSEQVFIVGWEHTETRESEASLPTASPNEPLLPPPDFVQSNAPLTSRAQLR
ncbi:hypothetical protein [Trichothermofontia sp.]